MKSGIKTYTCTVCKTTKTEAIPATGHSWNDGIIIQQPTAFQNGVKTYTCYNCGATKTESIPATGQNNSNPSYQRLSIDKKGLKFTVTTNIDGTAILERVEKTTKKTIKIPYKIAVNGVYYTIRSVKAKAFSKCKNTTKINLPSSITVIAKNSFKGARKLKTVIFNSPKNITIKKGAFNGLDTSKIVIKVNGNMSLNEFKRLKKDFSVAKFKGKIKKN